MKPRKILNATPTVWVGGRKVSPTSDALAEAEEVVFSTESPLTPAQIKALRDDGDGGIEQLVTDIMTDNINKALDGE